MDEPGMVWGVEVTHEKATQIRGWRVGAQLTWRDVAQEASDAWGLHHGSNQEFGQRLCKAAASVLGEDPHREPWN